MTRLFFDTNVLLDVLCNRAPFVKHAQSAWLLAEQGAVTGLVSTLSFANIYYIVRRFADADTARTALRQMRRAFTPVACDTTVIDDALAADFADFEDAIQHASATRAAADIILTRDPAHFAQSTIPALSPEQYLVLHRPG
jgi:predicted nucleic acid-binding protein